MGYSEVFLTERPQDGLEAVQSRLKKGRTLHEQLANYYKERAHIEDMYAKSITKAFQKHFVTDTQALGTFTAPWEKLNAETNELATLHGQFSYRITNEIERPMRDFVKNHPEWQNIALAETNCNRIAKEFEEKQLKVTKYTKAVEKVSGKKAEAAEQKLMEYTKQLESTRTAWRLEGPVVLQKYQNLDQNRLDHMKQMLAAFEALQTEMALQIAELSGRTSSSAAEFDSVMDMELFASEMSINLNAIEPHDGASIISGISHPSNGDTVASLDGRKSNGAHKRVMTGSSQLSNISYSTERSAAQSKTGSMDQTRTVETLDHARSASSVLGSAIDVPTNHVDADGFSIPPPDHGPWSDAGASSTYDDERSETSSFSQAPKMQMEIKKETVSESNDEARAALERVSSTLKQSKTVSRRHPGRREVRSMYQSEDSSSHNSYHSSPLSTGFTPESSRETLATPPAMNSPGSRAFFNTNASHLQTSTLTPGMTRASTLGLPSSSSPVQPQFSHSLPPTPSLVIANGSASASGPSPVPVLGSGHPIATEPESIATSINGSSAPTSPISPTHGGALLGAGQPQKWVASVIEKIHVHAQSGEISKMMVTGEVILNLEGTEVDPEFGSVKKALLRLDQLQSLDKHVPNPAYLSANEDTEGAYWVNLEALSQAMQQNGVGQGHGVVVLKYQVKTNEEDARQKMVPLMVHPAWKCEAHQTSLLINYKANAHCKLSQVQQEGNNVHLGEVSFLVPVSGDVTNVQSRPTGIWNSESSKMFWDVDNVTMSSTAPEPHKLLARFEMNPAGGASQPSATAVKFRVQGQLLSDLVVSLEKEQKAAGEEGEEVVEGGERVAFGSVRLQVQSGRYLATA
ncbi:hypothetical protein EC991_002182 [Linnemannia zychae]|nr:hypothetical protein EC991_002182 [Linnemannia zychae]